MKSPRVLLVEDNRLLRWCVCSELHRGGCAVVAPETVDEVMRLDPTQPVNVLVTDCRLADGHNGFEVLACVRQRYPQIYSILISAEADPQLASRARAAGFDVVIEKPCRVAEIVGAVRALAGGGSAEVMP
ncbi:MAG: response regulator [Acidobacteria bacterium]|nr:response regulator [Acidobacteriota bacterium]MBI3661565.1 response regulator [Acidobacteriota bacterium]